MAGVKKNGRTKRLSELEAKIKDGVCVVGESLHQIHELELYLDEYDNWNGYCKTTFGWTGAHCYQLIKNVKTLDNVSTIVDTNTAKTLKNDHLRELGKVPDAKQAEVAAEVFQRCESENRQPTAKDIKKVAAELIEPQLRPTINKTLPPPEEFTADPPPADGDAWKKLRSIVKQHANAGQRAVDDLQDQHPNTNIWKRVLKKFQEIASEMEGWK